MSDSREQTYWFVRTTSRLGATRVDVELVSVRAIKTEKQARVTEGRGPNWSTIVPNKALLHDTPADALQAHRLRVEGRIKRWEEKLDEERRALRRLNEIGEEAAAWLTSTNSSDASPD